MTHPKKSAPHEDKSCGACASADATTGAPRKLRAAGATVKRREEERQVRPPAVSPAVAALFADAGGDPARELEVLRAIQAGVMAARAVGR